MKSDTQGADGAGTKTAGQVHTIPVPIKLVEKARTLTWSVSGDAYLGKEPEAELATEVDAGLLAAQRAAQAAPAPAATPGVPDSVREAVAELQKWEGSEDEWRRRGQLSSHFAATNLALHRARTQALDWVLTLIAAHPAGQAGDAGADLDWAVSRWRAEVESRPLRNVHRRPLDTTWRQVIRRFGGDPDALVGPSHDTLACAEPAAAPIERPALNMSDPTPEELANPQFAAIWQAIKSWDVNVPGAYGGYCGATGSHAAVILRAISKPAPDSTRTGAAETEALVRAVEALNGSQLWLDNNHPWRIMLKRGRFNAAVAEAHPESAKGDGEWNDGAVICAIVNEAIKLSAALAASPEAPSDAGWRERVRHVKRGTEYEVLGEAEAQVSGSDSRITEHRDWLTDAVILEDGDKLTVYRGTDGRLWCRRTDEFRDGRFETITAPSDPAPSGQAEG